jgi:hypothetical protein
MDPSTHPDPADPSPGVAPALDEIYDDEVLARIEAGAGRRPITRRGGLAGAVVAGALIGVGEALDPERAASHLIEFVPDEIDEDTQLVTFHLVPGDPRASRIVVRPWLAERFRRRGT